MLGERGLRDIAFVIPVSLLTQITYLIDFYVLTIINNNIFIYRKNISKYKFVQNLKIQIIN